MALYNSYTPYSQTPINNNKFLDVMTNRPISKLATDVLFKITLTYQFRPDLLAYDLYGHSELWWVFAQRNPDVLVNLLNDFSLGTEIYLPKLTTLKKELGI